MKHGEIAMHDLDFDYKLWKLKINFYNYELRILLNRIDSLKKEHPAYSIDEDKVVLVHNQITFLKKVLNEIKIREQEMSFYSSDYPVNTDHTHVQEHKIIRTEMIKATHYQNYIYEELYPQLCYPLNFSYE